MGSCQIRKIAGCAGMPGTFLPPPITTETACSRSRHAKRHVRHARAMMHVGIANPRWRGKRSRHSQRMPNPQFYVTGERPIEASLYVEFLLEIVEVCIRHDASWIFPK